MKENFLKKWFGILKRKLFRNKPKYVVVNRQSVSQKEQRETEAEINKKVALSPNKVEVTQSKGNVEEITLSEKNSILLDRKIECLENNEKISSLVVDDEKTDRNIEDETKEILQFETSLEESENRNTENKEISDVWPIKTDEEEILEEEQIEEATEIQKKETDKSFETVYEKIKGEERESEEDPSLKSDYKVPSGAEDIEDFKVPELTANQRNLAKKISDIEDLPTISRKEKEALYEDDTRLIWHSVNPKYLGYLKDIRERGPFTILRNRIVREFKDAKLLCEIDINDNEFKILCAYFRKKYIQIRRDIEKPIIDIVFSVAVVQVGIRYYDGSFWNQVSKVLGIKNLSQAQRAWIGGTVTETLLAFGKPIFSKQEYVTNILMHGFVVDSFANRFFDFLFQYYNIDLQRDLSEMDEEDLEDLCYSIKNPFGIRKQMLSKYIELSVRANEEYCKAIIYQSLNMIDMYFWDDYSSDERLTGHYLEKFELWKAYSHIFKKEKEEMREAFEGKREKVYRRPVLQCDLETGKFEIFLPSQMIHVKSSDELSGISWSIFSSGYRKEIDCKLDEGYSGYMTREMRIIIPPEKIFDGFCFLLFKENNLIKEFKWENRKINFFTLSGHWVAGESLEAGAVFAFTKQDTNVTADSILARTDRMGLQFWEFDLHKGDVIQVSGENNYYIGEVPDVGLTKEFICEDVFAMTDEENQIPIYHKLPAFVVDVPCEKLKGTAIIINGQVKRLAENNFIDIRNGRDENKKYYYLNLNELGYIKAGVNRIVIDFPDSTRKIAEKFVYIPGFKYVFEDAPYVYQQRGTLKVNRLINKEKDNKILDCMSVSQEPVYHDFEMDELQGEYMPFLALFGDEHIKILFRVPVLLYSWNQNEWNIKKPMDVWYSKLENIIYIKFPSNRISLGIVGRNDTETIVSFNKNQQNIFVCDLTKLKTYFSNEKIVNSIQLIDNQREYNLFRVITKSFIHNVALETDYENGYLIWKCDILGENSYFADIICEEDLLLEKESIIDGVLRAHIPIHSAKYTIKIYESDSEFGFDDEYDYVGEVQNYVMSPEELIHKCMKISSIHNIQKEDENFELSNDSYIFISGIEEAQKESGRYYTGMFVELFHKDAIRRALDVEVCIPDFNKIESVIVTFPNDWDEQEPFLYDSYLKNVVEKEDPKFNKSEAYRRYVVLYAEDFYWKVQYVESNSELESKGREWIRRHKERSKDFVWKWKDESPKEISIDEVGLSVRSYNCLKRARLFTLNRVLILYQNGDLINVRNLGRKGVEEIGRCLKEHHLIE